MNQQTNIDFEKDIPFYMSHMNAGTSGKDAEICQIVGKLGESYFSPGSVLSQNTDRSQVTLKKKKSNITKPLR